MFFLLTCARFISFVFNMCAVYCRQGSFGLDSGTAYLRHVCPIGLASLRWQIWHVRLDAYYCRISAV